MLVIVMSLSGDSNQSDLEFEVFIYCWLLLAAEMTRRIADLQLTLKSPDGSTRVGERVTGDLKNWQPREGSGSAEESDWLEATTPKAPAAFLNWIQRHHWSAALPARAGYTFEFGTPLPRS